MQISKEALYLNLILIFNAKEIATKSLIGLEQEA